MGFAKLILKAPRNVQLPFRYAFGLIPPRIRYGRSFAETIRLLDRSEYWDRDQILEYQSDCLRELIAHAYENVPYYRETFDKLGLLPTDIRTVYDLDKLPFLSKETIQSRSRDLVARNLDPRQLSFVTTGGSTGIPLGMYRNLAVDDGIERAFIAKQWKRVGYRPGDKIAVFRGSVVTQGSSERLWEYNPAERALLFSSRHLTEDRIPLMVERLAKFRPLFVHAFPSSVYLIAEFMRKEKLPPLPSVRAVLCGSENLYQFQRDSINEAFQCRVYSWYGHSERAVLAGECEISSQYHVFPEYGVTELIGDDGRAITTENEVGEIVGTGFYNMAFPLIRYRTKDLAKLGSRSCECGRNHMLLKSVEGRLQELIVSRDGRYVSMASLNMHNDVYNHMKQFQFYQEQPGQVTLNIVRRSGYSDLDTALIRRELDLRLGSGFDLTINFTDSIPRTASGKLRLAIQKIPLVHGDR